MYTLCSDFYHRYHHSVYIQRVLVLPREILFETAPGINSRLQFVWIFAVRNSPTCTKAIYREYSNRSSKCQLPQVDHVHMDIHVGGLFDVCFNLLIYVRIKVQWSFVHFILIQLWRQNFAGNVECYANVSFTKSINSSVFWFGRVFRKRFHFGK